MKHLYCIVLLLVGSVMSINRVAAADPPPKMRLLVPAYFYPAGKGEKEWERLLTAPEEAGVVAIVNPASGPGRRVDANYTKVLEQAKKSKVTLIGYVSTSYGKRKIEEVKADVDQWIRFYPGIQGIFFDEQASGTEQLEQLATLYEHVRKSHKLSLVVTNPGTLCDEKYLTRPVSDVACLYEGHERWDRFTPPAWTTDLKPDRIAALSYQVPAADMPKYLRQAQDRRLGWIYITDDRGSNPWDQLPSYWEDELKELHKVNGE
ncbi:MAG: spherulation-specific family 4 protein [Pirellulaceae bacterium]|nr:spherulation-specific family 4 protein [Pirellulaceae bacterium]